MNLEIERKFLVDGLDFKKEAYTHHEIAQGYISNGVANTVRVRLYGNKAFLTIKGRSTQDGLSRLEWEKEIDVKEAKDLLRLCLCGIIEKTRYLVKVGRHIIEVDEFEGANKGLIMAEVELDSEDEEFDKPIWLGKEVTGDPRYYNAELSKNPFKLWK